MTSYFLILAFIFGTVIGSFLNVVAYRFQTGMGLGGRSTCFSCGKTLTWIELIPVASFLIQGGKCKKCKSKISWQYPVVEVGTGILFALVFYYFQPVSFVTVLYLIITSLLVVITIYDVKHKIIPDSLVYTCAVLALFLHPFSWMHLLAGPLLALPFFLLWLVSKGTWIGLGDAKLALGIGWVLPFSMGISAVILAFWIGAIISVLWMAVVFRKFKTRYEVPFGPYLILGMYLVLFSHIEVIDTQALTSLFQ